MITQENHTLEEERETRSSSEIESGIRRTRERMDATLDELGNRLNPRSLVNSAFDWWEENRGGAPGDAAMKSAFNGLKTHVRENPGPSLLIGAGLLWVLLKNRGDDAGAVGRDYSSIPAGAYENEPGSQRATAFSSGDGGFSKDDPGILTKAKDKAHEARETVSGLMGKARDTAETLRESADEAAHRARGFLERGRGAARDTGHRLQHKYYSGKRHFDDALEEYPLALGAAFAALGALTGVLLPHTRREDQLLGEKSHQLLESVKEKGGELLERGREVAGRLADTALEEAREKGLSVEAASEKLTELAGKTGEVVRRMAENTSSEITPQEESSHGSPYEGSETPASGYQRM